MLIEKDGYLDATQMYQETENLSKGRDVAQYLRSAKAKEFIKAVSERLGIPEYELIRKDKTGDRHTWMHPAIAMNFARWLSVEQELEITMWSLDAQKKLGEKLILSQSESGKLRSLLMAEKVTLSREELLDNILAFKEKHAAGDIGQMAMMEAANDILCQLSNFSEGLKTSTECCHKAWEALKRFEEKLSRIERVRCGTIQYRLALDIFNETYDYWIWIDLGKPCAMGRMYGTPYARLLEMEKEGLRD
jgi:KilA-N domain